MNQPRVNKIVQDAFDLASVHDLRARLAAAEAQVAALRDALKPYVDRYSGHDLDCTGMMGDGVCDCGFTLVKSEAIRTLGAGPADLGPER